MSDVDDAIAARIEGPRGRMIIQGTEVPFVFEQSVQSQYLDEKGREIPNPVPLAPPVGYKKQPTIADQMRQMIQQASFEAQKHGAETEEEANDFDIDEDFDPSSPWESDFELDPALEAMLALQSAAPSAPATSAASTGKAPVEGGGEKADEK